ncbi:MAG: DUF1127 domain-containing protein [Acidiferrobacterales bacterium]
MKAKSHVLPGLTADFTRAGATADALQWSAGALVDMLCAWHERARQRRALLALDDRMLKDIGITRADAERQASNPFWRI